MKLTCCKHYTTRLNGNTFKPSRNQRNALHKWTRYVLGEEYIRESAKKYPKSKEERKKQHNVFDLAESVHAAEYSVNARRIPPEPAHRFEVTLEPASFSEEKFDLFENYQRNVHHEKPHEITRRGFTRFLCNTPLPTETTDSGKKLGTYHQCYYLDGRLIAMGVLDLLPNVVSSVYFMYHSDFGKWNLGKVSACREACLATEGGYKYYYMGYYIPSCQKMRYKGEYGPSELLDPDSNDWLPLTEELKKQLIGDPTWGGRFQPDSRCTGEQDRDPGFCIESGMPGLMSPSELDAFNIGGVRIRASGRSSTAENLVGFEREGGLVRNLIKETVSAVGPEVASGMVMVFGH